MNSPIALRQFDEDEYRNHVRTLPGDELVKEGKKLRGLVGNVVSAGPPCVFDQQLRICREESAQASEMRSSIITDCETTRHSG